LRAGVFVDLYRVVRQGLIIGAVGYSIKDVERLYRRGREGAVGTAQDSVVEFDRWTESGEPADWNQSGILRGVRDYNRDDCISTLELADWLRSRQAAKGIAWVGLQHREEVDSDAGPRSDSEQLSVDMLNALPTEESAFDDDDRITQTLGWLLEYHRREAKPAWWAFFSRATQTTDELFEDADCLAGLVRTTKPPSPDKRSHEYEYAFDPDQETRMQEGNRCRFAHDVGLGAKIAALDRDRGITVLRIGNTNPPPPDTLDLVPGGPVDAGVLRDSIFRTTRRWWSERKLQPAMRDFLLRLPPRIHGRDRGEPVIGPDTDLVEGSIEAIANLTDSLLCIQGPPGCGKTFTAARCIIDLLQRGRRVGVTSNGHKAILNLLRQVASEATKLEFVLRGLKIGEADDLATDPHFLSVESASNWTPATGDDRPLVGGTAWAFAREDWARGFDYLFIDEAGQVPMANLIAVAPAARNLVVIGDQMQLDQPRQGTHPGHSGMSVMDYLLHGHPTIPPDRGVFLDRTWRLHPEICDFISKFVYEGRLRTAPHCRNRVISVPPDGGGPVDRSAGIQFHPCSHEGNSQESPEEVDAIERVVASLVGRGKTDESGNPSGTVSFDDILFVAPYNMQVNRLRRRLGPMARVASVDKFQGQEAPVVVLSMSASSTADLPRGMEFLLSQNRLNVALTRAQSVAIVVGSPALTYPKCATLDQMRVANFFCSLVDYASRADTASRP
jgi:uncharacterized protein